MFCSETLSLVDHITNQIKPTSTALVIEIGIVHQPDLFISCNLLEIAAKDGILALVAPGIILGSILGGFVTATEAGVLACVYSMVLGLFYKTLNLTNLWKALTDTMLMTSVIMIIIGFSIAMGWLLAIEQVPQMIGDAVFSLTESKNVFLAILIIFIIFTYSYS